jgi:hypothetical protein
MAQTLDELMREAVRGQPFGADKERAFQAWYTGLSNKMGLSPDPDQKDQFYDYRGFYNAMNAGQVTSPDKPGGHFSSQFKFPGHPRTYLKDARGRVFNTLTGKYVDDGNYIPENVQDFDLTPQEQARYSSGMNEAAPDLDHILWGMIRR